MTLKNFTLRHPGRPLSLDEIDAFERRHQVELPQDYRDFLLLSNGGMPCPQVHIKTPGIEVCVMQFHSLNDDAPYDLDRMCVSLDWEAGYKKGYLCIARDPGGSGIFISTRGSDRGCIYYLDREESLRPMGGILEIADSLSQLLSALEEIKL